MTISTRPNMQDPRVIRTRQLIQQAFLELLRTRDFQQITVSDVTRHATINRVTFYTHYTDKYELLDDMINSELIQLIYKGIDPLNGLQLESLMQLICALCEHHDYSANQCRRTSDEVRQITEKQIKSQLENYILEQLNRQQPDQEAAQLKVIATMVSWSLYGSTLQWSKERSSDRETPQQLAARIVPLLTALFQLSIQPKKEAGD
ncbi:TetR/AcrR family transcriptional regulator [Paenibacillus wulumuqiensis]|uniref:TetR/AcrR family transcriptional regulator n=1 Tax=Paenibacillus wulumuqiensis TaxID=1567107 RepID=UPI0006194872|nr:TetR family transcriptional regulator [Paenibacillus wulumuqiensis]